MIFWISSGGISLICSLERRYSTVAETLTFRLWRLLYTGSLENAPYVFIITRGIPSILTHLPRVSDKVVVVPSSEYPASGNIITLLLSFFTACRMSLTRVVSVQNFLVEIQPICLISQSLPKKASVVATMLNGFGYITVAAISRSMKLE